VFLSRFSCGGAQPVRLLLDSEREAALNRLCFSALWLLIICCVGSVLQAEPVPVKHPEGTVRGFLVLRTLDGSDLADGDLVQTVSGDRVTCRVIFRFRDDSSHDETTVISQRDRCALVSDALLQTGPNFTHPIDSSIEAKSGRVRVRYREEKGQEKTIDEHVDLPPDVANGLIFTLLKNIRPDAPPTTVSMVAETPKPRIVKLVISPAGEEDFSVGGATHRSIPYDVTVEGLIRVIASL